MNATALRHCHRRLILVAALAFTPAAVGSNPDTDAIEIHGAAQSAAVGHRDQPAARGGAVDVDADGVADYADNCAALANADQYDADSDGFGNLCDADLDNNGIVNISDLGLFRVSFFATPGAGNWNPSADLNGDGVVNVVDLGLLRGLFFQPPGPSGMACAGTAPCPAADFELAWPFPGDDTVDWVINNYVDLDAGAGVLDYAGGAKSYNGHRGIDINVPTFRAMDNDFPVLASAQGVVLALDDSHFDRNRSCVGDWNFVTLGHANGYRTIYGHLKRGSVVVNVGDVVTPGTVLGVVGSSGCSTHPHVHLETLDAAGNVIEPFADALWESPPVYDTPIGLMDFVVMPNRFDSVGNVADPTPNATFIEAGGPIGVAVSVAGGTVGSTVKIRLSEGGVNLGEGVIPFNQTYRHTFWYLHFNTGANWAGTYQVEFRVDDVLVQTHDVTVRPNLTGYYQVHYGVPDANYQALFDSLVSQGYRLTSVDGYDVGGQTFFNALFDFSPMSTWASAHNQTGPQFEAFFNAQVDAGRRLVHVDSYRRNGNIVYASLFVQQGGAPWFAYYGLSEADHLAQFNILTSQGYRAVQVSPVENAQGEIELTALYDRAGVGQWVQFYNMDSAQYAAQFGVQANAGRALVYLNGYTRNGVANFSAVWNSIPLAYTSNHDLDTTGFAQTLSSRTQQGLKTRVVTGYDNGGVLNLGGLWTN